MTLDESSLHLQVLSEVRQVLISRYTVTRWHLIERPPHCAFVWGSMNSLLSNEVLVRALKWDFHLETRDRDVMSITDKYMSLAIFPTFPPLLQNVISLMSVWLVFSVTFFFVNALFNVSSKASNTRLHRVIFNLIREFFVEGYKKNILTQLIS